MRSVVPLLLAALAACAPNTAAVEDSRYEAAAVTPSADEIESTASLYRETIRKSERLGRAIFEKDIATAFATDLLLESGALAGENRIIGWVTQQSEGSLLVTYVAEQDGRRLVGYEVAFPGGLAGTPTIAPTPPQTPLVNERAIMYNARETAISELRPQCNTNYNTVVLPASMIGQQGWLVYMLVATINPGERILAGHAMAQISPDGLTSMGSTPLSLSCLITAPDLPQGTEPAGLYVTHLTTAWPLETHVYTSLLYGVPVFVQTNVGIWEVDGDRIELIDLASAR